MTRRRGVHPARILFSILASKAATVDWPWSRTPVSDERDEASGPADALTMPGLPQRPAADMDIDEDGNSGLF